MGSRGGTAIVVMLFVATSLWAQVRPRSIPLDTLRLPNQLATTDSVAIYQLVVREGAEALDSLGKGHHPWLHVPDGTVADLASGRRGLSAPARFRGICDGTSQSPCPGKGHWFVTVGRLHALGQDSVEVPLSAGWSGPWPRTITLFPCQWTVERNLEVGLFPQGRVVRDGVFEPVPTPEFVLVKRGQGWHIVGLRLEVPAWYRH